MKSNYKNPNFHAPNRVFPRQMDDLKSQLNKSLQANIIVHMLKFTTPVILVKKIEKDLYRLVVSY